MDDHHEGEDRPQHSSTGDPAPEPIAVRAAVHDALRPALQLWLLLTISYSVGTQLMLFATTKSRSPSTSAWELFYDLHSVLVALAVVYFVTRDREARRVFARPRHGAVELCMVLGAVEALVEYMWWSSVDLPWGMRGSPSGHGLFGQLFWIALMPALFEEWAFRGVILTRLRRVLSDGWAIALSATMFSLLHQDPYRMFWSIVFGVVAGVMRVAAGALWPCMLWHLLWNTSAVLWPAGLFD